MPLRVRWHSVVDARRGADTRDDHGHMEASRAARVLRRRWWVVALATAAGAAVAVFAAGGQSSGTVAVLHVADESETLAAVRTTRGGDYEPVDLGLLARQLDSKETEDRLAAELGTDVVLVATADAGARTIEVRTPAAVGEQADAVLDGAVHEAQLIHRRLMADSLHSAERVLEAQLAATQPNDEAAGGGEETAPTRAELSARLEAIRFLLDPANPTVTVLSTSTRGDSPTATNVTLAVAGGVAGGGLAVVMLLLSAARDRRMRTVADVEEVCGPHTVLAAVPSAEDDVADLVAAAAIHHAARAEGFQQVRIVPAGALPAEVDNRLARAGARVDAEREPADTVQIDTIASLDAEPLGVLSGRADATNVVVVAAGTTTQVDVERTISALVRSGHHVAGLLFVGST